MIKAYLDTNVFYFSFYNRTNSYTILKLAKQEKFEVVFSDYLIREIRELFFRYNQKNYFSKALFEIELIPFKRKLTDFELEESVEKLKSEVCDKDDIPYICAYLEAKADYFVTTNRKLTQEKIKSKVQFITPKKFIELFGLESFNTKDEE